MGFALWIDRDLAWAMGTHEYRPMGGAVIAATGLFAPRDFQPRRRCPWRDDPSFVGHFASLGEVNAHLKARRKKRAVLRRVGHALPFLPEEL